MMYPHQRARKVKARLGLNTNVIMMAIQEENYIAAIQDSLEHWTVKGFKF